MCAKLPLFVTPWAAARQTPLMMEFSRQEYWSGLPFLPPWYLYDPGIKSAPLASSSLAGGFFTTARDGCHYTFKFGPDHLLAGPLLGAGVGGGCRHHFCGLYVCSSTALPWPFGNREVTVMSLQVPKLEHFKSRMTLSGQSFSHSTNIS